MENESQRTALRPVVHIDHARCLGCGQCLTSCPHRALTISRGLVVLADESRCDGVGRCLGHCSADALSLRTRPAVPFASATGGRQ
ncbi:MAG: 4Fe-4S dicluster domain-containing protein [Solidesulfovibrio sp.]|uniref:ATP-binding protein n=1 Tax=Solidesulfovibrio sp. TaxID=2910990 RepID=UPI002B1EA400|nr:4Fe-4S dicluster domain-containing protein [Solidesulfovibrio sp.]MEA4857122.1 4Fe-4S binding protein [Solidesulfovibrio sp.]